MSSQDEQHQIIQVLEHLGRALSNMPNTTLDECYWKLTKDIADVMQRLEQRLSATL